MMRGPKLVGGTRESFPEEATASGSETAEDATGRGNSQVTGGAGVSEGLEETSWEIGP